MNRPDLDAIEESYGGPRGVSLDIRALIDYARHLDAENDRLLEVLETVDHQTERIAELEEALRPFGTPREGYDPQELIEDWHFEAAAEVLKKGE